MLRLKELRKQNKLTQQQLAEMLGVTQAALSGWENEKFGIDNGSLLKCAKIFDVSIDYLLGRDEEQLPELNNKDQNLNFPIHLKIEIVLIIKIQQLLYKIKQLLLFHTIYYKLLHLYHKGKKLQLSL